MSSNKFSRLLSAVSQNTLYTETCKTVKKKRKRKITIMNQMKFQKNIQKTCR